MVVLEIDAGNTRCKWRLVTDATRGLSNACTYSEELPGLLYAEHAEVTSISIASVAKGERLQMLQTVCEDMFNLSPWIAQSTRHCGPVTNGYDDSGKLGVDRWLAVLAAFEIKRRACWVADFGSALTLDYIDADGVYRGGYIVPGVSMMVSALNQGTGNINVANDSYHLEAILPTNTAKAVTQGCILMMQRFVAATTASHQGDIYLTGGDARLVMSGCDDLMRYQPDLVLDGLSILKHNSLKQQ